MKIIDYVLMIFINLILLILNIYLYGKNFYFISILAIFILSISLGFTIYNFITYLINRAKKQSLKNKTADELFHELGYYKSDIIYENDNCLHYIVYEFSDLEIKFLLYNKKIISHQALSMREINAIYKKCKELGWL